MTNLIDNIFAVEVPDKYAQLCIDDVFNELYWWSYEGVETVIPLSPGNWQFICTTREVRAMHAPALFGHAMISDYYAQETTNALLTSKGLDVNKNYVLLKKK